MVKVESGTATREPVPDFLRDNTPESLLDLSWTWEGLGVQDAAWWPEEDVSGELGANKKWGAEVLTLDVERKVVLVTRKQVNMTAAEKAERDSAIAAEWAGRIAARRFQAETGGTTVEGVQVNTERDSQALLTGAAFAATLDPAYHIKWKAETGFVDLTGEQVLGIASQVRAFVQACFNREAELLGFVADGSITAEMLEEGWPV
ncbi:DUF4376 domain-containing protein [Pseudomonas sp. NIBR-H-19]|uniref:DUF4376 domain-containing protein n=1 Tax=Pseudomonas sp. NIBR-H-19 TaxID=2901380 RepID=UPI001E4143D6|nr:DUF4376 domain-containing protein [Pseudomonas sp. NIBR-H-19]UHC84897.1 DUF4376 domain-containing protein [Pseudomonas sp. NIBR-H-19]